MSTTLLIQGGEVAVDETYNNVRHKLNLAFKQIEDYRNDAWDADQNKRSNNKDGVPRPFHVLSFRTLTEDEEEGRFSVNFEKVIGVVSDEASDATVTDDDEEEYDDEEDEEEEDED